MKVAFLSVFGCGFLAATHLCLAVDGAPTTYTEGKVRPVENVTARMHEIGLEDLIWEKELEFPGIKTFRVHFAAISDRPTAGYEILLRSSDYRVVERVSQAEFAKDGEYWSDWVPGNYVVIQVHRLTPALSDLSFKVDKVVLESRQPKLESIVGDRDFEYPASSEDERIWQASRSVAKLSFVDGTKSETCTGFMINSNELLTNEHCVRNAEICRSLLATFGYEYDRRFKRQAGEKYRCEKILGMPDAQADFVVLEMAGQPGSEQKWGYLKLADEALQEGEPLLIIQHPSGELKRFVRKGCKVTTKVAPNRLGLLDDFGHVCDTDTGSSGSPILNSNLAVVGLHHLGFDKQDPRWTEENRGVYASKILNSRN